METVLHGKVDTALSSPHQVLYDGRSKTYKPCNNVNAEYFKDGKHCWISDGSTLTILKHGSSYIESYSNFERYFEGFNVKITCCKKYKNYLLVGLKTSDEKGYVCLHYPNIGRNLKTIEFPYPVTSLEVILTEGGANTSSVGFSQKLRWLFGVVAVGTEGGHIYLLDLRLDEEIDILRHKCHISSVEAVPTVVRDVPRLRDEVNQQKSHLAFELIESSHENGSFHYITMDDQIIETFDSNDISVSSMYFEPRATSLFVGFSFGQFHIFCLKSLSLVFSSDTQQYASAVVKFAFQEPENDPRNFCYLWLVKQSMVDEETNENTMNATMYQLMFQHKEVVHTPNSITSLYSNLECCSARFELILDATLGVKPMPGRSHLLQCTSVEHYCPMNRILNEEDKEENSTPDTSLLILGWGTITGGESRNVQVIVFDINRWYVCHMPSCYRVYDDEANYLVFWELDSVLPTCNSDLLCIHTPTSSLTRFKSKQHPCPELFLLPSSLSLTTNILLSDQTITCKMPGIQKQVMQFLSNGRLHCLLEPDETFQQMMLVGLIEQTNIVAMTVDRKREMILSAALDHGLFGFLSRVISDLSSGEHAGSGCSLRFIMEWAWKTVAIIKDSIDNLCVPIFDCGGVPLDVSVHNLLAFHNSQLSDIGLVFKKLLRQAISSSEQSKLEMETKVNVVQLIRDYLKVLRWFISARLLPEQWEAPQDVVTSDDFAFIYKHDELGSIFKERRSELGKLQRAQSSGSSESSSLLMIDGLIEDAGEGLLSRWKKLSESDDSCCYPPPSLMALLDMYYLDSMSDTSKHCIVTYFLLDMLAMHETMEDQESERSEEFIAMKNEHLQTVGLFPERFQLQHPTTKLIKAFWLLDHKEFHDSIRMFCEAGSSCPSLSWQHRRILLAYLLQGHHDLALRYLLTCQPPTLSEEDVKLKIDIYVKNNLPLLGLETVKINSEPDNQLTLFSHLFTSCHEQHLLKDLINLSVSKEEDDLVLKVLQSNVIPNSHEMLVFYHLHKSRHVEAIKAYHTNKHRYMMV
uniref:protein ELYS-like n=1 Tax=Ciona intestinalis TaxID=7719 RepID=UPI000EF505A6|nr:protein ELYS-like [Ciona intestinalis]|eukprot:XP_026694871.1 protein ELYS-like [Ciona intestinalis]